MHIQEHSKHSNGLQNYLETMLRLFRTALPSMPTIELYSGAFTTQQLSQIAKRTPALLLSCLGIKELKDAPTGHAVMLDMACFILVGNAGLEDKTIDKNIAILPFVETVLAMLDDDETYSISNSPMQMQAENLYSPTGVNVATWAIHWEQRVAIGNPQENIANLEDFLRAGIQWEVNHE